MARYIDIEPYKDGKIVLHDEDKGVLIKDIPTAADVQEVRHGKWVVEKFKAHTEATCSVCSENYRYQKGQYHMHFAKHCPNCGAKMDKECKNDKL